MAMTKCRECGKEISGKAESCPHCGYKPKRTSPLTWFVAIVFGIPIIIAMATSGNRSAGPSAAAPPPERDLRQVATGACLIMIKRQLHDPGSAEFAHSSEARVNIKDGHAVVVRNVRAKNAFGAKRLSEFTCLLDIVPEGAKPVLVTERGAEDPKARAILADWKMRTP